MKHEKVRIYTLDTTLRDGGQTSGVSFSVDDKLRLAEIIDGIGVDYIEAGWPGANAVDTEFFDLLRQSIKPGSAGENQQVSGGAAAKIACFGMTTKLPDEDALKLALGGLAESCAQFVSLVGKTWDMHVIEALKSDISTNKLSISRSVEFLRNRGKRVLFDAEHFFDGYKDNKEYALECIEAAMNSGCDWITLCDTNGGSLPAEVEQIVKEVCHALPGINIGIHCHDDTGCAVANSLAAVRGGARLVQGTLNGLGERCGNANLITLICNLVLKMGFSCGAADDKLGEFTRASRTLDNVINLEHKAQLPYTGSASFAHKGGLHASAVLRNSKCYEHIKPELVGNDRKILVSNQAGRSNVLSLLKGAGIKDPKLLEDHYLKKITECIKNMETLGYNYEDAEASLVIMFYRIAAAETGNVSPDGFFKVISYRVIVERRYDEMGIAYNVSQAFVKIKIGEDTIMNVSESEGPVGALYSAIMGVIQGKLPMIKNIGLIDYKVRIIKRLSKEQIAEVKSSNVSSEGSVNFTGVGSITKVNVTFSDPSMQKTWNTAGVSQNIIDASFIAIYDAICYYLHQLS